MKAGWKHQTLGGLCELISGQHIEAKDYNTDGVGVAYLTGPSDFGERNPVVSKWTEFPKRMAKAGDILITVKGSGVGKINFLDTEVAISRQLMAIRPTGVNPDFLYSFLLLHFEHFQSLSTGAAIPGISREDVLDLPVPLPPAEEQQRLVAILNEAFNGIATANTNTEKNLQNAGALFSGRLHAAFEFAYQTYETVELLDLATDITDGDHLPPPKSESGVPFITIGNIDKRTREIDFSDTFSVPQSYFQGLKGNRRPRLGDVLYTVTGSFGIPVLVAEDRDFCFQRHIGLVRPKPGVESAWLEYLLLSPQVFSQAEETATGTAQKTVSLKSLRGFRVPKVPVGAQRGMVATLDAFVEESEHLESIYRQKLAALDELKQSLLHRAFNGDL